MAFSEYGNFATVQIPGDGRELVAVDSSACKIRAEDGRQVENVDISPFISNLPYGESNLKMRPSKFKSL